MKITNDHAANDASANQEQDALRKTHGFGGGLKRAFTEHPASVNETYFEHMAAAGGFGAKMVLSGLACLLHAVFPFLFVRTGRNCIIDLHDRLVVNRCKNPSTDHRETVMPAMKPADRKLQAAE